MGMKMVVTPKFKSRTIVRKYLTKNWERTTASSIYLGQSIHAYIQGFIQTNHKRVGGTGNLARSITFDVLSKSPERIAWGIGLKSQLPKYWYVINYGKKYGTGENFIPGGGKFVPGNISGNAPSSAQKGVGTEAFDYRPREESADRPAGMGGIYPGVIRPMHYIEATKAQMDARLKIMLLGLKKG